MLTVEQALEQILADVPAMPGEDVPLEQLVGRTLSHDVVAPRDLPPWDNSAMDGYAVRAADTGERVTLRINETVGAGGWPALVVQPGTATAIMTGAPMPQGADSVVMVEDTDGARQGGVEIRCTATPGQHVRRRGDDVKAGHLVLHRATRLTAAHVGMAASLGLTALTVARRPVVGILSTGDEVVAPGRTLGPGQIHSSNNHALFGQVLEAGAIPRDFGNAPDDPEGLCAALRGCLDAGVDVVVTTGGVSVGVYDFVKDAFANIGGEMSFWRVRMKPGKPLAFGRLGVVPLFGLPGNPVSCMVNFLQFVRPWLRRAMGSDRPFLPVVEATATAPFSDRPGRDGFVRVVLEQVGAEISCRPTGSQSSGVLTSMVRGHGFALVPASSEGFAAGDRVRVQVFDGSFLDRSEPGYGWS